MEQEILEKNPKLDVRVYAIWFRMYGTDSRGAWPADALPDRRVVHRWDESRAIGTWYAGQLDRIRGRLVPNATGIDAPVPVLWDPWLIYAPDATLTAQPAGLVKWGRTILNTREMLRQEVGRIVRQQAATSK